MFSAKHEMRIQDAPASRIIENALPRASRAHLSRPLLHCDVAYNSLMNIQLGHSTEGGSVTLI